MLGAWLGEALVALATGVVCSWKLGVVVGVAVEVEVVVDIALGVGVGVGFGVDGIGSANDRAGNPVKAIIIMIRWSKWEIFMADPLN